MKYIVTLFLIVPFLSFAEIYKWTDQQGKVHFGDSPENKGNAEIVTVEVNSYKNVTYEDTEIYQGTESPRVTMYATSWCGYCKKARRYFNKRGISYLEYDIEKDEVAKRMYDLLGGKGVPVILVGKKRMNGFSVAGFERIYR